MIRVPRVDSGHTDASKVDGRLAAITRSIRSATVKQTTKQQKIAHHPVENLARVSLEPDGEFNLVSDSDGVLSSGAFEKDVDSGRPSRIETLDLGRRELLYFFRHVLVDVKVDRVDSSVRVPGRAEPLDDVIKAPLNIVDEDDVSSSFQEGPLGAHLRKGSRRQCPPKFSTRSSGARAYQTDGSCATDADDVAFVHACVHDLVVRGDTKQQERLTRSDHR